MKTITIASAKGGSLKTSLTAALSVRACQDSLRVAMLDLNEDQGSLAQWWGLRGKPAAPHLDTASLVLSKRIKLLAATHDWAFIDTAPGDMELIEEAVAVADAVVIPMRPGLFDLVAAQDVVTMCRNHGKPYAFVLTAVDARHQVVVEQMLTAINRGLGPHFKTQIRYRKAGVTALTTAKTAAEIDKDARKEIGELWAEVKAFVETGAVQ